MNDALFIVRKPVLDPSTDFAHLRREGLQWVERLAHELWTDYNVHDPGVTMLELMCYAITDLGYRTGYDIKDLLTEEERGVPVNRSQFHTAYEVMTCAPVSFDDLRKLLIDIPGVRNAWIEKHQSVRYFLEPANATLTDAAKPGGQSVQNDPLGGLFDVLVEYEDEVGENGRSILLGTLAPSAEREFTLPRGKGMVFGIEYPVILQSVSILAKNAGTVTLCIKDSEGKLRWKKAVTIADPAEQRIRVKICAALPPGEGYSLTASSAAVKLAREPRRPAAFDEAAERVMYLEDPWSEAAGAAACFFYAWEINYTVIPAPWFYGGAPLTWLGPMQASAGAMPTESAHSAIEFSALRNARLEAVSIVPKSAGEVRLRLLDGGGRELAAAACSATARTLTRLALDVTLERGKSYRLDAAGSKGLLLGEATAGMSFPAESALRLEADRPDACVFYAWEVHAPLHPNPPTYLREEVRLAVKQRVLECRSLCQDVVNICDLGKEEIALCAEIEAVPSADLEELLAEMLYRVWLHVSPSVRFYTIEELKAKGKTADEIFEGPQLEHGFIDDEELGRVKRRCEIRTSDVVQILMDVQGAAAVKSIALLSFVEGRDPLQAEWVLPLDGSRTPVFSAGKSKIIFYKHELPYYANRKRVEDLLKQKQAADSYRKLKGHKRDLPIPVGEAKQLQTYYPAQNELPRAYATGRVRVAESEPPLRKAQSRQLKAYLMLFEQVLANYLAQLAHVRQLFSWEEGADRTYFSQVLGDIGEIEALYDARFSIEDGASGTRTLDETTLQQELDRIAEDTAGAGARDRRLKFLDHLIARFCETFADYGLLESSRLGRAAARPELIRDERAFLADYPVLSRSRGTGYDYRFPDRPENVSGFQRRLYRLLGIRDVSRRNLAGHRFALEPVTEDGAQRWRFVLTGESGTAMFRSISCESPSAIEGLLDFALGIGGDPQNYRLSQDGLAYELVRRCSDQAQDEAIGATVSKDVQPDVIAYFERYGQAEGFHVVEHILLRKRTAGDTFMEVQLDAAGECTCPEVHDPYSFRMSVLLPSWPRRFQDLKFRALVEDTLRREAPAHLFLRICWLSHAQMKGFEAVYNAWCDRLAHLDSQLAGCSEQDGSGKLRGGEVPLPPSTTDDAAYGDSLANLIETMGRLVTVYPLARLHDCVDTQGDQPQISLNNTSLGTF